MIRLGGMALALACAACGSGGSVVVENVASVPVEPMNAAIAPVETPVAAPAPAPVADAALTENELAVYPEARGMPADVQRYLVRRADCEHWSGEEPYDADRKAEIERNVNQLCAGLDAETATLRTRHAGDPVVAAALAKLDSIGM
ncbi:hypothetical protein P1X14_21595 [Sphingomonas sp. AOB5]|uniref:hypothetical protein n=1 Tax=Sphingomonas sp. AOB5 TaxID=3034017 RepID=UPI0023FA2835|nr:hypothetical protein [Sphingomonas sp. AOB5]MDF7777864.1 hypothetical protein [Sphingomonas sp. AOB5]